MSHWAAARQFLGAALVIGLIGCMSDTASTKLTVKADKDRQMAPDFKLKDSNGDTVKLSDFRGKVVLLNFWATWCSPCQEEIPWFTNFEQEYKNRGLVVLGVSLDDDGWDSVRPYLKTHQINYRILVGNDSVAQLYGGVEALPTTFVIDRSGKIASVHQGLVSKSVYQNEILHLLDSGNRAGNLTANIPAAFVGSE